MSGKDGCVYELRPEASTRPDIFYLFGQGNINFVMEKLENFEKFRLWQPRCTVCLGSSYLSYYSVIFFVGKVPLGTSMRDAEKLYSECADQV